MILVGPMQLHQPQSLDPMEPFFLGTQPDGGYWLDMSRLSSHNHTGGLNGPPVTAVIPPGSITSGQLDPAVLAPYALTDGSKPFTAQVTMQADAVVRDALFFGEQGTALAPDASLTRTAAGTLQLASSLLAPAGAPLTLKTGTGAGTVRASLGQTGSLSLSPDVGVAALTSGAWSVRTWASEANSLYLGATSYVVVDPGANLFAPARDNGIGNGGASNRWTAVYAVSGTINTSLADAKQDITPLDPAVAMAAVRATTPCTFDYLAPERTAEWYELPDDPEQAEAVLYQRLVSAPLEAGARHQSGVVLNDPSHPCDPLFATGEGQTNPSNSVGILLAAVKSIDQRLTALGG